MSKEIGVAIVGAGMAGQAHAFGYRNASMADALQGTRPIIRWFVDPQIQLAEAASQRYGAQRFGDSVDEMLADPAVDVVSVAIPNHLYAELLPKVIRAGKHVLAEKPLGSSAAEAAELTRIARESDRVCGVGFSYRRVPGVAALRKAVLDGVIGEVHTARAFYYADYAANPSAPYTWRFGSATSGGGAVMDIGPHVIDGLISALGDVSTVVSSVERTRIKERRDHSGSARRVENDDISLTTLEFASGAVATVELSRISQGNRNRVGFEYFGDGGSAWFDTLRFDEYTLYRTGDAGPAVITTGPTDPFYADVSSFRVAGVGTGYGEAFIAEVQEFLLAVVEGRPMDTDFENAVRTMQVVDAAQQSAATGAPTKVQGSA